MVNQASICYFSRDINTEFKQLVAHCSLYLRWIILSYVLLSVICICLLCLIAYKLLTGQALSARHRRRNRLQSNLVAKMDGGSNSPDSDTSGVISTPSEASVPAAPPCIVLSNDSLAIADNGGTNSSRSVRVLSTNYILNVTAIPVV